MLFAHINMQIALASESTLYSSIDRPRGKIGREKSDQKYASHLMYAVKQNPVLKLMGAHFYRTENIQTMYYLSLYHT